MSAWRKSAKPPIRTISLKVLILTGAGDKAFASGTDINQFRAFKTARGCDRLRVRIDRVLGKLEQCRVPTIAAITGACTGGGAGIAACCDLRVGTKTAKFGFPIARTLGNCLSMSNVSRLTALIGPARVKDVIFTARLVGAEEARVDQSPDRGGRRSSPRWRRAPTSSPSRSPATRR